MNQSPSKYDDSEIGLSRMMTTVTSADEDRAEADHLLHDRLAALAEGSTVRQRPAQFLFEWQEEARSQAKVANHIAAIGANSSAPPTATVPTLKNA